MELTRDEINKWLESICRDSSFKGISIASTPRETDNVFYKLWIRGD